MNNDNSIEDTHSDIVNLIKEYADVYFRFERKQNSNLIFPKGDQKTGVIGEYYSKRYIQYKYPDASYINFAKSGESFDIEYKLNDTKVSVQVKTVSAYSDTRRIAPLSQLNNKKESAFDLLYLIALDTKFIPTGFYIIEYDSIKWNENTKPLKGLTMRGKSLEKEFMEGSKILGFRENENLFLEMNNALMINKEVGG